MLRFILSVNYIHYIIVDFNTSHVTVYRSVIMGGSSSFTYFNTSHVTVYHDSYDTLACVDKHFNTSHVTVYRSIYGSCQSTIGISIHPMLRFIPASVFASKQPSIISIHPMLRFIVMTFTRLNIN